LEGVEEVKEVEEAEEEDEIEDGEVGRFVTVEGRRTQRNRAARDLASLYRVEWTSVFCFL
jgi:hypothetical protein